MCVITYASLEKSRKESCSMGASPLQEKVGSDSSLTERLYNVKSK